MKSALLFTAFCIAFCMMPMLSVAQAKTVLPDTRLNSLFDADYLQRLQSLQPVQLERLNYYLDHSFEVQTLASTKTPEGLPEAVIPDISAFNIVAFEREHHLFRNAESPQIFHIKNTNQILVLLSEKEFVKRFNAAR